MNMKKVDLNINDVKKLIEEKESFMIIIWTDKKEKSGLLVFNFKRS